MSSPHWSHWKDTQRTNRKEVGIVQGDRYKDKESSDGTTGGPGILPVEKQGGDPRQEPHRGISWGNFPVRVEG